MSARETGLLGRTQGGAVPAVLLACLLSCPLPAVRALLVACRGCACVLAVAVVLRACVWLLRSPLPLPAFLPLPAARALLRACVCARARALGKPGRPADYLHFMVYVPNGAGGAARSLQCSLL